jgi:hypothetical protein
MDLNNYYNEDIVALEKDIKNFENNISKLKITTFYVDNYRISYQSNNKISIKNKILKKEELIKYINQEKQLKKNENYKLNFIIKFNLNYDLDDLAELETQYDKESYKLQCLKKIDDIDYNDSKFDKENTLILFFNKIYKIQKPNFDKKQKNSSRKQKQ